MFTLWNKPRRQIYRCFYKQQKCSKLQRKGRGNCWQSVKKKCFFLKAFEIYIHATQYNPEDAFGCNKCPGELLKGESEDDFEDVKEVLISDRIDMGNMQYPSKGLLERDLFKVPKVTTGVHCSVTSELFRVNIFNDSVSTFLTILCQHF